MVFSDTSPCFILSGLVPYKGGVGSLAVVAFSLHCFGSDLKPFEMELLHFMLFLWAMMVIFDIKAVRGIFCEFMFVFISQMISEIPENKRCI